MSTRSSQNLRRAVASPPRAHDGPACLRQAACWLLTLALFSTIHSSASAQEIHLQATPTRSQPAAVDEPYSYSKIILAMGVVVGIIFLLKWAAAKVTPAISPKSGKAMSVLSRLSLGSKQQLLLIKVGRRAVLVGHAGAQMNSLCEITDPDELAHLVGQAEGEKPAAALGSFGSIFKKREREFEPTAGEIAQAAAPEEDEHLAQLARRELLGLSERVRGMSEELNGV